MGTQDGRFQVLKVVEIPAEAAPTGIAGRDFYRGAIVVLVPGAVANISTGPNGLGIGDARYSPTNPPPSPNGQPTDWFCSTSDAGVQALVAAGALTSVGPR